MEAVSLAGSDSVPKAHLGSGLIAALRAARWWLHRVVVDTGLPGRVGLALAAVSALGAAFVVLPAAHEETRLVESNAALVRQRLQARLDAEAAGTVAPAIDPLVGFERRFEGPAGIVRAVARLERSALREGVVLEGASFKLERSAEQTLARYTIDWPVRADYAALRRHIAQALRDDPALALVSLQMQRDDPTQPRLTARLRWVLFVAPEAGRSPSAGVGLAVPTTQRVAQGDLR